MNDIVLGSIFLGKGSRYMHKTAISTPGKEYTYNNIADFLSACVDYLQKTYFLKQGDKVILHYPGSPELILLFLALVKAKAAIVLVDPISDDLEEIAEMEKPLLVITDEEGATKTSYPVFIPIQSLIPPATYEQGLSAEELKTSLGFSWYSNDKQRRAEVSTGAVLNAFDELKTTLQPGLNEKYLVTGAISSLSLIIEGIWCLFNDIHILYYPGQKNIKTLLPDAEHFPMDFSLFFFGSAGDTKDTDGCYNLVMKSAEHADQHGYTGVWTPERHFNEFGGKFPNPSILSAAIAMKTKNVQIRTGSIVSPLHHVVRIAEDWSIIDNLSNGRGALSFASGWQCNDFVFYPERYSRRHEIMLEQLQDLKKLWSGEQMEFENGVNTKIKINIYPKPVQPELPIWITVSGKTETFIDAGRIGANILTHLLWQDPSDLIEKIQAYRDALQQNGFHPASRTVSVMLHTYIGNDLQAVKEKVRKPLKDYIGSSLHLVETMIAAVRVTKGDNTIGRYGRNDETVPEHLKEELLEIAFERFFNSASLLGDPDHCNEIMKKLKSYGVDELACLVDFGLDTPGILEGLEELNKLRKVYKETHLQKYRGPVMLRTDAQNLEDLLKEDSATINSLRKVIIEPVATDATGFVKQEIHFSYSPGDNTIVKARQDSRFEEQKARLHELNLAQANEKILEDF